MSNSLPLVSIIVLSHDRPDYLRKVLDSITEQSHPNLEIIVVDNRSGSSDQIAAVVRDYGGVKLIQNGFNIGFTGGMNKGIRAASGDYVHCTVDDVLLDKDCIRLLAEHMESHPSVGLASGILFDETGETIRCAGGEFNLTPVYRQKIFGVGEKDKGQFSKPYEVKYVPGGMTFCRLDLMKELNGFREEFFMYAEDADLCARVTKLGYAITVVPQAKVCVLDAPHAFKSEGIAYHKIKNHLSLYLLHAPLRVLPEFYLRYSIATLFRAVAFDRKLVWPLVKAWRWFLVKMPTFVKERWSNRKGSSSIPRPASLVQGH